jgi:hypothetical protein
MRDDQRLRLSTAEKWVLVFVAAISAARLLERAISSLTPPVLYGKDLVASYLLTKAIANGVYPYSPLPDLMSLWLPTHGSPFSHPTPHPISIGWLCLPLAFLSYEYFARAWFVIELICLGVSVALFFRLLEAKFQWRTWGLFSFLALAWPVVNFELITGQFNLLLLVLVLLIWLGLRERREITAGVLLGIVMLLKMAGWPVILWLAWKRRWIPVGLAIATFACVQLLAIQLHELAMMRDYYLNVAPSVDMIYRSWDANFSAWTFGQRLFAEFGHNFVSSPLLDSPPLTKALNLLAPLSILGVTLWLAERARSFDTSFALLVAAGTILNPVAWTHYLILTSPAWVLVFNRLHLLQWPRSLTLNSLLVLVLLSMPRIAYTNIALLFQRGQDAVGRPLVPGIAAMLTLMPLAAVCALLWLLSILDSRAGNGPAGDH